MPATALFKTMLSLLKILTYNNSPFLYKNMTNTKIFYIIIMPVILLLGIGYVYASYFYLPQQAQKNIIAQLENFGFEKLSIGTIETKNGKIIISDLSLDPDHFSSIEMLSVKYSLFPFIFGKKTAHEILVSGLNMTGNLSEDHHIRLSGWDKNANIIQSLLKLSTKSLIIENSKINLLTPDFGGAQLNIDGYLTKDNDGVNIKGHVTSEQRNIAFQAKVNGALNFDGQMATEIEFSNASIEKDDLNIKRGTSNLRVHYNLKDNKTLMKFEGQIPSMRWGKLPLKDVHITQEEGQNNTILMEGKFFGPEEMDWTSQIVFNDQGIKTQNTISPKIFSDALNVLERSKLLKNKDIFPEFIKNRTNPILLFNTTIDKEKNITGNFDIMFAKPNYTVRGDFKNAKDKNTIIGTIYSAPINVKPIKNTPNVFLNTVTHGNFVVTKLQDVPEFNWSSKMAVLNGQFLLGPIILPNIAGEFYYSSSEKNNKNKNTLMYKLPLKPSISHNGNILLNIENTDEPLFKQIDLNLYGGKIRTQMPLINGGELTKENKLFISDISLTQLFYGLGFKNIRISGKLGGVLPLKFKDNKKITVNGGILQSLDRGIIQLPDDIIRGLFPGHDKETYITQQSLKNFHYEYFEIRIDGNLKGNVMMTLKASGYNPDFYNKDAVEISLQLETQTSTLFNNLLK